MVWLIILFVLIFHALSIGAVIAVWDKCFDVDADDFFDEPGRVLGAFFLAPFMLIGAVGYLVIIKSIKGE